MRTDDEAQYVGRLAGVLWDPEHLVRPTSWLRNPEHADLLRAYRYATTELGAAGAILADVTPEVAVLIWKIMETSRAVTTVARRREEFR